MNSLGTPSGSNEYAAAHNFGAFDEQSRVSSDPAHTAACNHEWWSLFESRQRSWYECLLCGATQKEGDFSAAKLCANPEPHGLHEWYDGMLRRNCPGIDKRGVLPGTPAGPDSESGLRPATGEVVSVEPRPPRSQDARSAAYERRLAWLRTFRGYTQDEAELAAWAADEIERLREALEAIESMSGAGGAGQIPAIPIADRARKALA